MLAGSDKPKRQQEDLTGLLNRMHGGDPEAGEQAASLVYDELHRLASREMRRERPGHTLQTTALIHEAYLKLVGPQSLQVQNRAHFFAIASQQMRRILVDHARATGAQRRGAGAIHIDAEGIPISEVDRGARASVGPRRCAKGSGAPRLAGGPSGGTAVFRRLYGQGSCRGTRRFPGHHSPGLGIRSFLVVRADEQVTRRSCHHGTGTSHQRMRKLFDEALRTACRSASGVPGSGMPRRSRVGPGQWQRLLRGAKGIGAVSGRQNRGQTAWPVCHFAGNRARSHGHCL